MSAANYPSKKPSRFYHVVKRHQRISELAQTKDADDQPLFPTLTPTDFHVLKEMNLYSSIEGGGCFPSLSTLAKGTGHGRATVTRSIKHLRDAGLLQVVFAKANKATEYRVELFPDRLTATPRGVEVSLAGVEVSRGGVGVSPGGVTVSHEQSNEHSNEQSTKQSTELVSVPQGELLTDTRVLQDDQEEYDTPADDADDVEPEDQEERRRVLEHEAWVRDQIKDKERRTAIYQQARSR